MIAVAQWLRIWVFSMEVSGSNAGKKLFFDIFNAPFYWSISTLRLTVVWFLPCNSIAVNAISFKPQKV